MNYLCWISSILLLLCIPTCSPTLTSDLFENWLKEHGKTYTSEQEKQYRFNIFEDNYAYVASHNSADNSSYTLSLNGFADLSHQEFKAKYLGFSAGGNSLIRMNRGYEENEDNGVGVGDDKVPDSLDWRNEGAVTKVKDQASCGACWSFSATGAIEGINKIVTGSLISLSEQELIDCDKSYNSGCGGGLMDYAYEFIKKNGGIDTEEDYPFQGRDGKCNQAKLNKHVVTIDGYNDVPENKEQELLKAVAKQPVSVGICGSERAFQLYSKGVFTGPCSTSLDHAVLIVGYDSSNGVDYWIIKNSWGTSWGIDGYMYMQRNSGSSNGICGINMLASYPIKTSPNPPPGPSPTKCSVFTSCNAGETCCCTWTIFGVCLSWKCCELESAVCCEDKATCCPHDYPICDTERHRCLKQVGNMTFVRGQENQRLFSTSENGGLGSRKF
ncbi:hypothetical protein Leryth_014701 [Lithospermum erythrorhizon]|nr:hypothetical protein Leryth_014701 [Lithospermum erythrorhizon]